MYLADMDLLPLWLGLGVAVCIVLYVEVTLRLPQLMDDMRDGKTSPPCLDCGKITHTEDCALRMDNLVESPVDAAARRSRE